MRPGGNTTRALDQQLEPPLAAGKPKRQQAEPLRKP